MLCTKCNKTVHVYNTRNNFKDNEVYRRYVCKNCGINFFTVEYEVFVNDSYIKQYRHAKDKSIKTYNSEKVEDKYEML